MMVVPVLMGAGLYVFTQSPYGLIMIGASPLMLLASTTGSRRDARRRYVQDMADYQKRRVQVEEAALDSLVSERGARRRDFPDPASVLLFATGPRARLWERRRWDSDFLHLRIGTSDLPSEVTLKDPARDGARGSPAVDRTRRAGDHPDDGRRRDRRASPTALAPSRCGRSRRWPRCTARRTRA